MLHRNIGAVEADLALVRAPPAADAAFAATVAWARQTLRILAKNLFHGSDPGHLIEAIEREVPISPSRLTIRYQRYRCRRRNVRHGVALLCGIDTSSLAAQGGQRLPSYFNIDWGNPMSRQLPA
jgi:hypothetical protein